MENETVSVKVQGQRKSVELVIENLKKLFPLSVVGPIKQNDADSGVHVFVTINPQLANKVMEA